MKQNLSLEKVPGFILFDWAIRKVMVNIKKFI